LQPSDQGVIEDACQLFCHFEVGMLYPHQLYRDGPVGGPYTPYATHRSSFTYQNCDSALPSRCKAAAAEAAVLSNAAMALAQIQRDDVVMSGDQDDVELDGERSEGGGYDSGARWGLQAEGQAAQSVSKKMGCVLAASRCVTCACVLLLQQRSTWCCWGRWRRPGRCSRGRGSSQGHEEARGSTTPQAHAGQAQGMCVWGYGVIAMLSSRMRAG
jgi:hypothetical protein